MRSLLLLAAGAWACGASVDADPDAAGGGPGAADGRPGDGRPGQPDADRSDCPAGLPANLGKIQPLVLDQSMTAEYYFLFASVSDEPDPVIQLAMRLYRDKGLFPDDVQPGFYTITGVEADYQHCSACIFLYAEKDALPYAFFTASAGLINLESVGGELSGSMESVTLRRVDIVNDGEACDGPSDPVCDNTNCIGGQCGRQVEVGDCEVEIGSLDF